MCVCVRACVQRVWVALYVQCVQKSVYVAHGRPNSYTPRCSGCRDSEQEREAEAEEASEAKRHGVSVPSHVPEAAARRMRRLRTLLSTIDSMVLEQNERVSTRRACSLHGNGAGRAGGVKSV